VPTLLITGFSIDETYPFGPVQKKVYGATPPLGLAVRVKLSPSQIAVEDAVGFTVGSAKTRFVFLIVSGFELVWELEEFSLRLVLLLLISITIAKELKEKKLKNIAINK